MLHRRRFSGSRLDKWLGRNFGKIFFGGLFGGLGFLIGYPGGIVFALLYSAALGLMMTFIGNFLDSGMF